MPWQVHVKGMGVLIQVFWFAFLLILSLTWTGRSALNSQAKRLPRQLIQSLHSPSHSNSPISAISASASSSIPPSLSSSHRTSTCRRCKKQFSPEQNTICVHHPGIYSGRLNRINDVDTSDKEFFWSCCGEYELHATGCLHLDKHCSYDDNDDDTYSVFTGKRVDYKR